MKEQQSFFDTILEKLEGDSALWSVTEDKYGYSIWPFIRHRVLFHLLYARREINSLDPGHRSTFIQKLRTVVFSIFSGNPFLLTFSNPSILIFNSGVGNVRRGRVYANRLADYFYRELPDKTSLLEETSYGRHQLPRHKGVYSHFFFRLAALVIRPFIRKSRSKLEQKTDFLLKLLQSKLGVDHCDEPFVQKLRIETLLKLEEVYAESMVYRLFFKFVKPRWILVEDACYGSRAHLIFIAKSNSIKVAEYQHGFINKFHLAYNYGSWVIKDNFCNNYLPDVFLSYGDYWNNTIRIPVPSVSIGNPYLSEYTPTKSQQQKPSALVLGAGVGTEFIIRRTLELCKVFKAMNLETYFRPHPLEWANAKQQYHELVTNGIHLDTFSDLYDSFSKSSIVVGELSTALFEARRFSNDVYLVGNSYDEYFGGDTATLFPSVDEGIRTNFCQDDVRRDVVFWQSDWKANYRKTILNTSNAGEG